MTTTSTSATAPVTVSKMQVVSPAPSRSSSFARRYKQRLNAIGPLSVPSNYPISPQSEDTSPTNTSPQMLSQGTTTSSIQHSPEGPRGRIPPASPSAPLQLPDAMLLSSTTAMSEAVSISRGPGLIRRLSRGAATRLVRRRTSSTAVNKRDHSTGPAMMRRRSDSRGELDDGLDVLDSEYQEFGEGEETPAEPTLLMRSTATTEGPGSPSSGTTTASSVSALGPVVPPALERGTILTKVSKKKRKLKTFVLDMKAAKVSWDPAKPHKRFYIDDIREIRIGADARHAREELEMSAEYESRWFTIILADEERTKGRPTKTMHLIAPDEHCLIAWTSTLEVVSRYRIDLMMSLAGQSEKAVKTCWQREMAKKFAGELHTDSEERLGLEAIENICHSLHVSASSWWLRGLFASVDTDRTGSLDYPGFKDFVKRLNDRKDIRRIYSDVASNPERGLSVSEFFFFLVEIQNVDVTNPTYWETVFEKFAKRYRTKACLSPDVDGQQALYLRCEGFCAFLSAPSNAVIARTAARDQKLDRPLNEYFISSSHNTYLVGRQVAGESSTEAYILALQRGCRCVEVDCWDGADGRPLVNHGRTLSSSVLFSDCISVIGRHAFTSSSYPLIISLEVHCCPEQQIIMADTLQSILGDQLVTTPLMTNSLVLPSPEDLRHRILIKVKSGNEFEERLFSSESATGRRQRAFSSPPARPVILEDSFVPNASLTASPYSVSPTDQSSMWGNSRSHSQVTSGTTVSASSATEDSDSKDGMLSAEAMRKKKTSKIIKPLGDLGVYTRGQKFGGSWTMAQSKTYNHVFSFGERTFDNHCRDADEKSQLERHNMRYLMRVYPGPFRITSSNFDPNRYWRRGVQMVALNWQTYDLAMQMNNAMFAAGLDRTGYVLKPKELRQSRHALELPVDAMTGRAKIEKKLVSFSFQMISAQQLPRPKFMGSSQTINPYIELETFCADDKEKGVAMGQGGLDASARNGMSGIGSPHRRRSKIIQDNGHNPVFDDEFKVSLETKFPELIFVRWSVWHSADSRSYGDKNGPVATFTAKLSSLQEGYRHLPLQNPIGEQYLFSTLFCRIQKGEEVSVHRSDAKSGKVQSFKQFGRSVFGRKLSLNRKNSTDPRG
ncbi:MAG: Phospholipase C [Caeruleum heppii]|nr:MAG: Phospholipase C [Caeruleum heppii]